MRRVSVAHPLADLADLQSRVKQQFFCLLDAHGVEDVVKALARVPVQQLRQVPLGNITAVRHRL